MESVKELLAFLRPFDLGGTREKSAQMTSGRYNTLQAHISPSASDSPTISALKQTTEHEGRGGD